MTDDPTANFYRWLALAKSGERYQYHTGFLMDDRENPGAKQLNKLADSVWGAYELGSVRLFQKRDGEKSNYLAEKV